jgi:hypothetical protein
MVRVSLLLIVTFFYTACGRVKENAKEVIVETGKTVGKTGSEFVQSVNEGVESSLNCTIKIAKPLQPIFKASGKVQFQSKDGGKDNVCSIYLIFEDNCNKKVSVKVVDEHGVEYGRSKATINGKKGEATFIDFEFDKRTNLEAKSTFELY